MTVSFLPSGRLSLTVLKFLYDAMTYLGCTYRSILMRRMIRIVALLMAALMAVTTRQAPDSDSRMADGTVDVSFTGR